MTVLTCNIENYGNAKAMKGDLTRPQKFFKRFRSNAAAVAVAVAAVAVAVTGSSSGSSTAGWL